MSANKCHWTPGILRHGNVPTSLHPRPVHLDCSTVWADQEKHKLHLELHIWCHLPACQGCCCQWHHPPVLWPFTSMTIHIDASQVGLGAALLQNNKPIAFVSKTLTETECHYANIEREMLGVLFGAERFRTYVYGRSFTIKSDHKALESASQKNLADMPAWFQCMLLYIQGYDYTICYHPSK